MSGDMFSQLLCRTFPSRSCLLGFQWRLQRQVTADTTQREEKKKEARSPIAMATTAYLPPPRLSLWAGFSVQD